MAVTTFATEYSTQWGKHINLGTNFPGTPMRQPDDGGNGRYFWFTFTQGAAAGDATSTMGLVILPAGRWRIAGVVFDNSAMTGATVSIGHGAYTTSEGVPVAASAAAFASAVSTATASTTSVQMNVPAGKKIIDSRTDVQIYATVAGAVVPAGATLNGYVLAIRAE
jgi:hypothetical protein